MSKRGDPIAQPERVSSLLTFRRAWWANCHGWPMHKGSAVAPRCLAPGPARDKLQRAVNQWWWRELDDKARAFLGEQYSRDVTVSAADLDQSE